MREVYLVSEITMDSIVDGKGLRAVVWFQGCSHNCIGCHNPETHAFNVGKSFLVTDVFKLIDTIENQDGITFSGGDPMFQPEAFLEILKYTKGKGYNIWCYTGFVYEDLQKMSGLYQEILRYIDVLVDGKFDINKKSLNYIYRGSSNQRVIDLNQSLKSGKVIKLYE